MTGKGQKAAKGFASLRKAPEFMGLILLLIVIILNIITQGAGFFSANNFSMIFSKNTPLILLTMAQSIVILTGNIDLSVGIQMSMVNVLAVMLPTYTGMPIWVAWIVGFLAAVVVSTLNGIIVGYLRIPPHARHLWYELYYQRNQCYLNAGTARQCAAGGVEVL